MFSVHNLAVGIAGLILSLMIVFPQAQGHAESGTSGSRGGTPADFFTRLSGGGGALAPTDRSRRRTTQQPDPTDPPPDDDPPKDRPPKNPRPPKPPPDNKPPKDNRSPARGTPGGDRSNGDGGLISSRPPGLRCGIGLFGTPCEADANVAGHDQSTKKAEKPTRRPKVRRKPAVRPLATVSPPPPKPVGLAGFGLPGRLCLDPDLHGLLTATYGIRSDISPCAAGCVPRPHAGLTSAAELDARAIANDVAWCPADCVRLSGLLPVDEVLRLERLTGRIFCMADGAALCNISAASGMLPDSEAAVRLSAVLGSRRALPAAASTAARSADIALVIGNGAYGQGVPSRPTASLDVAAITGLLSGPLGFSPGRIIVRENLDAAGMAALLEPGGPLDRVGPMGSLFIYVSAHGRSDPVTGATVLLGSDAVQPGAAGAGEVVVRAIPAHAAGSAGADAVSTGEVPLADLYAAVRRVGARSALVMLEVNFGGAGGNLVEAPNLPGRDIAVLPQEDVPGLSVFTAADRDQHTLIDPDLGTGLFTAAVVHGLSGAADEAPIGNGDRRIEAVELYVYIAHRVRVSARKMFGLEQKPLMARAGNALIGQY